MVKKIKKYLKFVVCCALIMSLVAPSYAALSASDGSAFVTKAEFDSALADFNARLTTFEAGINSKIDSQVSSYLDRNGIWNGKEVDVQDHIITVTDVDLWPEVVSMINVDRAYIDTKFNSETDSIAPILSHYASVMLVAGPLFDYKAKEFTITNSSVKSGMVFIKYTCGYCGQFQTPPTELGVNLSYSHDFIKWYKNNNMKSYTDKTSYDEQSYSANSGGNGIVLISGNDPRSYNEPFQFSWAVKFKEGSSIRTSQTIFTTDMTFNFALTRNSYNRGMNSVGEGHLLTYINTFFVSKGSPIYASMDFSTGGRTDGGCRWVCNYGTEKPADLPLRSEAKGWCVFGTDIEECKIY